MREGRNVTHVRNCKKFREPKKRDKEQLIIKEGSLLQAKVERERRMSCHVIDVAAGGSKWTFQTPAHFCKWVRERRGEPSNIYAGSACTKGPGQY